MQLAHCLLNWDCMVEIVVVVTMMILRLVVDWYGGSCGGGWSGNAMAVVAMDLIVMTLVLAVVIVAVIVVAVGDWVSIMAVTVMTWVRLFWSDEGNWTIYN